MGNENLYKNINTEEFKNINIYNNVVAFPKNDLLPRLGTGHN